MPTVVDLIVLAASWSMFLAIRVRQPAMRAVRPLPCLLIGLAVAVMLGGTMAAVPLLVGSDRPDSPGVGEVAAVCGIAAAAGSTIGNAILAMRLMRRRARAS